MSVRENIASNLLSTISSISSPAIIKATRQPFQLDELSDKQYPAVIVQTSEETREDSELGDTLKGRNWGQGKSMTGIKNNRSGMILECHFGYSLKI